MKALETERLVLRWVTTDDAEFILQLVNEPAWLQHIGDREVRTLEASRNHIETHLRGMYRRQGFGLNLVALKKDRVPVGICGLIKRDALEDADLGFAFHSRFWSNGYAFESASAVMADAKQTLGLTRLAAVTAADNHASAKLLGKLGFRFERMLSLTPGSAEIKLFSVNL